MKRRIDLDQLLDRTLEDIRGDKPEASFEGQATERVWARLSQQMQPAAETADHRPIRDCSDFQSLVPDYLSRDLSGPRSLLVKDHLTECLSCRRVYKKLRTARTGVRSTAASGRRQRNPFRVWGVRLTAAAAAFILVMGLSIQTEVFSFETGALIDVEMVEGELYKLTEEGSVPLGAGDLLTLEPGEQIRTAKDSTAVIRLADNSQMEMRERSQLAVTERHSLLPGTKPDGVIGLDRGSIIVEASDQGSGHLYVNTDDCRVAVKGTVFSVNHGTKGSRVSVIEGEVEVDHAGQQDRLMPGDQTTTHPALTRVPVTDEIAWSRDVAKYRALLKDIHEMEREIDRALSRDARHSTALLDVAPEDTVLFVAIPNLAEGIDEAFGILMDRLETNEVLRAWWEQSVRQAGAEQELQSIIDRVLAYGDEIGDEIALTLQMGPTDNEPSVLVLAQHSTNLLRLLEADLAEWEQHDTGISQRTHIIEGGLPFPAPAPINDDLYFWSRGDLLAVTPDFAQLQKLDMSIRQSRNLAGRGGLHDRLAALYDEGVEWAVGLDVKRITTVGGATPSDEAALQHTGILDAEYLIAERKHVGERNETRAALTFERDRRGMVAWLAEPAPMGSLDYISPDAHLVAAFVTKDMSVLVDEMFAMIGAAEDDFTRDLAEFEAEHGIDVRADLAAPLGGEFAMALDGPVLPEPGWKLVAEVYDPDRLLQTLEWALGQAEQALAESGRQAPTLERQQIGGREYYALTAVGSLLDVHFVFDEGYIVAASSRALLDMALNGKANGISLSQSTTFTELLPHDARVNFSALAYQNLGEILAPVAGKLNTGQMTPRQQALAAAVTAETPPGLALLYGDAGEIVFVSTSEGGLVQSGLGAISGVHGLAGMRQSLFQALDPESMVRDHLEEQKVRKVRIETTDL